MPGRVVEVNRGRIASAFIVLGIVFTLVVAWDARLAQEATRLGHENSQRIRDIESERSARVHAIRRTAIILCEQTNDTNRRIVGYIVAQSNPARFRKVAYYRQHPKEIPNPKVVRRLATHAFPIKDCSKLPSQTVK